MTWVKYILIYMSYIYIYHISYYICDKEKKMTRVFFLVTYIIYDYILDAIILDIITWVYTM